MRSRAAPSPKVSKTPLFSLPCFHFHPFLDFGAFSVFVFFGYRQIEGVLSRLPSPPPQYPPTTPRVSLAVWPLVRGNAVNFFFDFLGAVLPRVQFHVLSFVFYDLVQKG